LDQQIMRATVKEKREVAKGTLMVTFDLRGEEVEFRPGQYFFVTLLDPPYEDEKGPRRHITVVTSPNDRGTLGLATRLRDSAFKKSLQELEVGDEVEVEPPKGKFMLPEDTSRPLVFIAGGIGITVFWSMLQYIEEEALPHRVTLIHSNRNREETAFLGELQAYEQRNPSFRLILTMTQDPGWDGESRRIDAQFLRDHLGEDLNQYTFMVAGPPDMVDAMKEALAAAGVAEEHVLAQNFSGY
jgi:ferredoxin-NADP reductase